MEPLHLKLFGDFKLVQGARDEIALPGKTQMLLAYLALNADRRHPRDKLAALIWADRAEEQVRHSLRQCLFTLGKALGDCEPPLILADRHHISLNTDRINLDVWEFERLAAKGSPKALQRASALYSGDLLEGLVVEQEELESWYVAERARLRDRFYDVLVRLTACHAEAGELDQAIHTAWRLVSLDPIGEDGHRTLMRLYERANRRSAALKQYRVCAETLRRELDVEPEPETTRLYLEILGRRKESETTSGLMAPSTPPESRPARDVTAPSQIETFARRRRLALVAGVLVLVTLTGIAGWLSSWESEKTFEASLTSPLSAKSSIAVLPFANLSGDPEQDYLSNGITDDIITDLSKFRDLFVIASDSVFPARTGTAKTQEAIQGLGVRYVLEGSVHRVGERVRVNVQLIDATSRRHLWANLYEEDYTDIFDLENRITRLIVRTLAISLTRIDAERAFAKPTRSLAAYDFMLRGREYLRRLTHADNFKARQMFRKAIGRDRGYAAAYAGLGWSYLYPVLFGWTDSPNRAMERADELARQGLALDDTDIDGHRLLGRVHLIRRQYDLALVELERAIALNPNDADSHANQGVILLWSSRPDGAILALETALRFNPKLDAERSTHLGLAYYLKGRYDDAVKSLERSIGLNRGLAFSHTILAAVYAKLGRFPDAARQAETVRRLNPFFSTDAYGRLFREPAHRVRLAEGLRMAGLPE
jgi:TolB-like protein/DNA-binding SARP family transcriptional activator